MPRKKKTGGDAQGLELEEGVTEETGDNVPTAAKRNTSGASDNDELGDELTEDLSEDDDLLIGGADDDKEDEY